MMSSSLFESQLSMISFVIQLRFMAELNDALERQHVKFHYEAAVCGGIPIINTFKRGLSVDKITKVAGIMNGTTNYIMTKMAYTTTSLYFICFKTGKHC